MNLRARRGRCPDRRPPPARLRRRLATLYPEALFPPVFFLVGRSHAGGAVQAEGVLIAVETHAGQAGPEREDLVHLVAHELAHYQQAAYDVERYQRSNSLLARAIKEGVADYVAELLTGDHINPVAHAYGERHEWSLWSRFRCEMDETETGDWFFTTPRDPAWPNDLGYYVGYRIAALRYARETSPNRALAALLRVDDYVTFLRDSGYEAYLEQREKRRFPDCPRRAPAPGSAYSSPSGSRGETCRTAIAKGSLTTTKIADGGK